MGYNKSLTARYKPLIRPPHHPSPLDTLRRPPEHRRHAQSALEKMADGREGVGLALAVTDRQKEADFD
jgi:hypothetical protein